MESIHELVRGALCDVYPLCYPQAAVDWFCQLHDEEAIAADVAKDTVHVLVAGDSVVATEMHLAISMSVRCGASPKDGEFGGGGVRSAIFGSTAEKEHK